MIELKVEEYCHDCDEFEVDVVDSGILEHFDMIGMTIFTIHKFEVCCAHRKKCKMLKNYLEQKGKK